MPLSRPAVRNADSTPTFPDDGKTLRQPTPGLLRVRIPGSGGRALGQTPTDSRRITIGSIQLDPDGGHIWKDGVRSYLPEQPLALLQALLDARGGVVSREELRKRLWADDTFVDFEHGVNATVKRLREALGDNADAPQFIETIPRRGYRLIAPVARDNDVQVATLSRWRGLAGPAPIALAVLLLVAVGVGWFARPLLPKPTMSSEPSADMIRLTHDGGLTTQPSVSEDGQIVVYASDRAGNGQLDLWVLRPGALDPVRLTTDPADESEPSVSPDGNRVAFRSEREGGGIYLMPTHTGGQRSLIAAGGHNPRFSPDGKYIAYWTGFAGVVRDLNGSPSNKVFVVSADGGSPVQLMADFQTAFWPIWAPDSKHVLVTASSGFQFDSAIDWYVAPIDGGGPVAVRVRLGEKYKFTCLPRQELWRADTIVFSVAQADTMRLWQTHISSGDWKLGETAEELTTGPEDHGFAAVSSTDSLVFASTVSKQNVWELPIVSDEARVIGPIKRVTDGAQPEMVAGISLDGTTLSFTQWSRRAASVRIMKGKSPETTLLIPPAPIDEITLSPDGSRVAYRKYYESGSRINVLSTRGGASEDVCGDCGFNIPLGWSRDNTQLLYMKGDGGRLRIFVLSLASGSRRLVAEHPSNSFVEARFSPDDHWVSFVEMLPGQRSRIWVIPADRSGSVDETWVPITTGESWDDKPRWSPSGTQLYFVSQRDGFRCIWVQRLDRLTKRPLGARFAVKHFHGGRLSMMNVQLAALGFAVASERLAFNLGEVTGNLWSIRAPLIFAGQPGHSN